MRFRFTEDQRLLAASVRDFLDGECTPSDVRTAWEEGPSRKRWQALAELGVLGLTVPTEHGGLGLDAVSLILCLEECGRAALPEPIVETTAVAAPLLAELGGQAAAEWLPRIATGELIATVGLPGHPRVAHAGAADLLLLAAGGRIAWRTPDDVELTREPVVDRARPEFGLSWDATADPSVAVADEIVWRALDRARVGTAAVLLGASRRLVELAVAYAGEREQFGAPIGSFQAVKHLLADVTVAVEFAGPVVYRAAWSLAEDADTATRDAALAKVVAADAAQRAARAALQVHGAIGYTWEHDLHLWMKKVWALSPAYGTTEELRDLLAQLVVD